MIINTGNLVSITEANQELFPAWHGWWTRTVQLSFSRTTRRATS